MNKAKQAEVTEAAGWSSSDPVWDRLESMEAAEVKGQLDAEDGDDPAERASRLSKAAVMESGEHSDAEEDEDKAYPFTGELGARLALIGMHCYWLQNRCVYASPARWDLANEISTWYSRTVAAARDLMENEN